MRSLLDRLMTYELKALLNRWGDWLGKHQEDHGLPTASAFTRIPGNEAGHKILCAEMPRKIYFLNQAILKLEPIQQLYIAAWYIWAQDEAGHVLDQRTKALRLGLTYAQFAEHVRRSRQDLLHYKKIWVT